MGISQTRGRNRPLRLVSVTAPDPPVSLGPDQRLLVGAGYLLSGVAVVMHFWEIAGNGAALHQRALLVITVGFLLLTLAAAVGARRGRRHRAALA